MPRINKSTDWLTIGQLRLLACLIECGGKATCTDIAAMMDTEYGIDTFAGNIFMQTKALVRDGVLGKELRETENKQMENVFYIADFEPMRKQLEVVKKIVEDLDGV